MAQYLQTVAPYFTARLIEDVEEQNESVKQQLYDALEVAHYLSDREFEKLQDFIDYFYGNNDYKMILDKELDKDHITEKQYYEYMYALFSAEFSEEFVKSPNDWEINRTHFRIFYNNYPDTYNFVLTHIQRLKNRAAA